MARRYVCDECTLEIEGEDMVYQVTPKSSDGVIKLPTRHLHWGCLAEYAKG
jgi:hypothetical protein